jgi:anti-sigma factor RsiW
MILDVPLGTVRSRLFAAREALRALWCTARQHSGGCHDLCDAAEYISALCDGETIPPAAAQHIATCRDCEARLGDYLAMGVDLRRTASLALAEAVPSQTWTKPQNRVATWWQKGWGTMRIPRVAFAILIAGILFLASALNRTDRG